MSRYVTCHSWISDSLSQFEEIPRDLHMYWSRNVHYSDVKIMTDVFSCPLSPLPFDQTEKCLE